MNAARLVPLKVEHRVMFFIPPIPIVFILVAL
jgi:hypothetical protein